jgi:chaperonin cofactor prefoldin
MSKRVDKLEAFIKDSNSQLREEMRERDEQLEARTNEGFKILRESIDQLREDIRQTNTRLDASTQALGAEISKLTEKIEANSHDLRAEIARLNQNHVHHLEYHEESRQRSEQK